MDYQATQAKPFPTLSQRNATEAEVQIILSAVKERVKDPDSVRVRNIKLAAKEPAPTGGIPLCGEYNAKNSYGGYVGFQWFAGIYYPNAGMNAARLVRTQASQDDIIQLCREDGLDPKR